MTLDALRVLCALVESPSFRFAAERVHRSQPAVSQQLKALERELGHTLIERRTCAPTPVGQVLYQRARHLLGEADSLVRELEDFDEAVSRPLRIGTSDTTALYFLPPFVRTFSQTMPHTRLVILNRPSEAIAEQVLRGDLDLGIVTLPVAHEELEERALFEQRLVLVTPKRHRLGRRTRVRLTDLVDEQFLLLHGQTRTGGLLRDHLAAADFAPQVVMDSASFEVIKRYVAEGIGLSFLPETAVSAGDRGLATVLVEGLPRVCIGAIWRRGAYRTKAERVFFDLIAGA